MNNFYDYFEVMHNANINEILLAYENKITKYNNLNSLTNKQVNEIKLLKKGLYILSNNNLREKYDKKLNNISENNIPIPENDNELQSFDTVFNVDNAWMKTFDFDENKGRKNIETNILNNRVFSLSDMNKQKIPTDTEIFLRKQQCGREEKK